MKSILLLLLATVVAAELSAECQYVADSDVLREVDKVKTCFETYTIHQDVIDAIIRNLELIGEVYAYVDIAKNPPSEPEGYFNKIDYAVELENLKKTLAESGGVVSKVFRPAMKFVNQYHDAHFNLYSYFYGEGDYKNIFSSILCNLPFSFEIDVDGDERRVKIKNPMNSLPSETVDKINNMYNEGYYVSSVDNGDAFEFFYNFFGEYDNMKSPQGRLINAMYESTYSSFSLLEFPLDNAFEEHTVVFSDPDSTSFTYNLTFWNNPFAATRDNREKRDTYLQCGTMNDMNYIQIRSFSADNPTVYIQELIGCVSIFDSNDLPITIILPYNSGGSYKVMSPTQIMLMPKSNFNIYGSMRKSEWTRYLAVDKKFCQNYYFGFDNETCTVFNDSSVASFWDNTIIDDFGNGVKHNRTERAFGAFKESLASVFPLVMKNVRKPTDIIVATDGYCFSACSFFVNGILRSGSAIVAGFGPTVPGYDYFAAGQCSSTEVDMEEGFDVVSNNSVYGLKFRTVAVESYDPYDPNDYIPDDYKILNIDKHTGYYKRFSLGSTSDIPELLRYTSALHEEFKTKCNSSNTRLRLISEDCESDDPYAVASGYVCGSNGEWDKSSCKTVFCQDGYIVDFATDKCVPNTCDPRYTPPVSSSASSTTGSSSSTTGSSSSSTTGSSSSSTTGSSSSKTSSSSSKTGSSSSKTGSSSSKTGSSSSKTGSSSTVGSATRDNTSSSILCLMMTMIGITIYHAFF